MPSPFLKLTQYSVLLSDSAIDEDDCDCCNVGSVMPFCVNAAKIACLELNPVTESPSNVYNSSKR